MARTKQTARHSSGGRVPRTSLLCHEMKQSINKQQRRRLPPMRYERKHLPQNLTRSDSESEAEEQIQRDSEDSTSDSEAEAKNSEKCPKGWDLVLSFIKSISKAQPQLMSWETIRDLLEKAEKLAPESSLFAWTEATKMEVYAVLCQQLPNFKDQLDNYFEITIEL